jgi:hypothetical protein
MYNVSEVGSLVELMKLWPRILKCAKNDCQHLNPESFLCSLLKCFRNGKIFIVKGTAGLVGSCAIEHVSDQTILLHSIPNDKGTGIAKACLDAIKHYAKEVGGAQVFVTTTSTSGASFRYFKHILGFRQHSITFNLIIPKN